jgi:hypothetical protein
MNKQHCTNSAPHAPHLWRGWAPSPARQCPGTATPSGWYDAAKLRELNAVVDGRLDALRALGYTHARIDLATGTISGSAHPMTDPAHDRTAGHTTPDDETYQHIDLDAIPRIYATGDLVIETPIGLVHIIRTPEEPTGPLSATPRTDIAIEVETELDHDHPISHVRILGHLGRAFTVAYNDRRQHIPNNAWTELG